MFKCLVVLRNARIIRPLHSARPFQREPLRSLPEPYFFRLKPTTMNKLYSAHHDVGAPLFASAMTRSSSATRFAADGNRDIFSTVTWARIYPSVLPGLEPPKLRRRRAPARRNLPAGALWSSFVDCPCSSSALRPTGNSASNEASSPRSAFVAVDVFLLAPVFRDPCVSKNSCKAIGCWAVTMIHCSRK